MVCCDPFWKEFYARVSIFLLYFVNYFLLTASTSKKPAGGDKYVLKCWVHLYLFCWLNWILWLYYSIFCPSFAYILLLSSCSFHYLFRCCFSFFCSSSFFFLVLLFSFLEWYTRFSLYGLLQSLLLCIYIWCSQINLFVWDVYRASKRVMITILCIHLSQPL